MIIGYDAKRVVSNTTGLGSYGRTLINSLCAQPNLADKLILYAPRYGNEALRSQLLHSPHIAFAYPPRGYFGALRSLWRVCGMTSSLLRDGVELFHGLSGELPTGLKRTSIASVVTIHDLIFLRHPEYYHPLDVQIYRWKFHNACRQADRMIAISERTKQDIIHYGNFPEDKIDVVYQSCAKRFADEVDETTLQQVRERYALPQRFILNVGTIEERKNILLAVEALPLLPHDIHLVIVGRSTRYANAVLQRAKSIGVAARLHIFHGVTNKELPAIYHLADCFVYPSRYEGFGLPIIEAIQCGLAVAACTGSCLEEAGGDACLYVAPDDVSAMANALKQLLDNPQERAERIARSRQYITRFENNDIALQIKSVYQKTLLDKHSAR